MSRLPSRPTRSTAPDDAPPVPQQIALPFWPEHLRGVPKAALYSALFAPIRKGAREAVQRESIASINGYRIVYTGFRLDQADLDVFEQVLHMFRGGAGASRQQAVHITTRDMLKRIGRAQGKANREWLLKSLARLQACAVEIEKDGQVYSGSLISEQARNREAGDNTHAIIISPRLVALFDQGYSQVVWAQRLALARKPLAQWLHGFIAGQRHPLTFKLADLTRYADSNYARERDFRAALDEAARDIRNAGVDLVLLWGARNSQVTLTRTAWKSATAMPPPGV